MKKHDSLKLAWAAGIVDGEGCITIRCQRGKYYALKVTVGQSGTKMPKMLIELKRLFGGSVGRGGRKRAFKNSLPTYQWAVATDAAEKCVRAILPYLVEKVQQARVALQYRALVGAPGKRQTEQQHARIVRCYEKLQQLKPGRTGQIITREKDNKLVRSGPRRIRGNAR